MNDPVMTTPLHQSTRKLPHSRPSSRVGYGRRQARAQYGARAVPAAVAASHPDAMRPSLTLAYRAALSTAISSPGDGTQGQETHAAIQPTFQQRFDFAFSLYNTRAREELHEFRALCAAIAQGAHEEKRQWQALCARVMQERDAAKAKLQELITEQQRSHLGLQSSTDTVKQESPEPSSASSISSSMRGIKRGTEPGADDRSASPLVRPRSASVRSAGTPPPASYSPPPVTPTQLSPTATIPPATHSPSPSPEREDDSHRSSPSPSDSFNERQPKRRRSSYDSVCDGLPSSLGLTNPKPTPAPLLPDDFVHVDLMYNRQMNGSLVCRACLFESEKSDIYLPPTTFPARASWDALRHHCVYAHPSECADVARLHPAEIYQLRQRVNAF